MKMYRSIPRTKGVHMFISVSVCVYIYRYTHTYTHIRVYIYKVIAQYHKLECYLCLFLNDKFRSGISIALIFIEHFLVCL